jgi:hypothetical protein
MALLFVLAVAGCTAISVASGDDDSDDRDDPALQRIAAENACEDFLRDKLKSPSTAEFHNTMSTSTGPVAWRVSGTVDAENSFGAALRRSWSCTVRLDGDTFRGTATLNE